jgi:hypothetical protein
MMVRRLVGVISQGEGLMKIKGSRRSMMVRRLVGVISQGGVGLYRHYFKGKNKTLLILTQRLLEMIQ